MPSAYRATGFGILSSTGRVASILAQVVNGSLSSRVPLLLGVTSLFMGLGCVGPLLLPAVPRVAGERAGGDGSDAASLRTISASDDAAIRAMDAAGPREGTS